MLEKISKDVRDLFDFLSQIEGENYKMYDVFSDGLNQGVKNSVESVEICGKNRRQSWTFELCPRGFQHVEKTGRFYNRYTRLFVENFCLW